MKSRKYEEGGEIDDRSTERRRFDLGVSQAKKYLRYDPESKRSFNKIRTLLPAVEALRDRGVDVDALAGKNEPTDSDMKKGGKVKGYAKDGMTASKRADGIAERGKTRGTIVACGGGYMKGKK